jgi:putative copper export protein
VLEAAGGTPTVTLRAIALVAITIATGVIVFHWCVLPRAGDEGNTSRGALDRLALNAGLMACCLLLLVEFPRLWYQAQAFADAGASPMTMIPNVRRTTWGAALAAQSVGTVLAGLGFGLARFRWRAGWWIATLAMLGVTLSPAMMGHPIAAEQYVWLNVGADWVHVISVGSWIGALALLALASTKVSGAVMGSLIAAFHRVALASVALLVVSGVISLWMRVAHFLTLFDSTYGTVFFTKLACVACVLLVGAWHSRRGEQHARAGEAVGKSLIIEVVLAMIAIGVTAVLVGSDPPGA